MTARDRSDAGQTTASEMSTVSTTPASRDTGSLSSHDTPSDMAVDSPITWAFRQAQGAGAVRSVRSRRRTFLCRMPPHQFDLVAFRVVYQG